MNPEPVSTPADASSLPPAAVPLLPLSELLAAIGDASRWRILRELANGDSLMVTEIAAAVGASADSVSKHLTVLRRAGITQIGRARLQSVTPRFIVDPAHRVLDFGYLQLRLGVAEPPV